MPVIRRMLLPVSNIRLARSLLPLAVAFLQAGGERIVLSGVVHVTEGRSLSVGVERVRRRRRALRELAAQWPDLPIAIDPHVRVTHTVLGELVELVQEHNCDTLMLPLNADGTRTLGMPVDDVLTRLNCRVILLKGSIAERPERILLPSRGGRHAVHALSVAMAMSTALGCEISVLRAAPLRSEDLTPGDDHTLQMEFEDDVITREVNIRGDMRDLLRILPAQLHGHQMLVLGTTAYEAARGMIGFRTRQLLSAVRQPTVIVYAPLGFEVGERQRALPAFALNVERWFAENTFDSEEFNDLARLVALKEAQGVTISLGLPALNEEKTIGKIITTVREELMERHPLLDEIVLIDSNSTDRTVDIAEAAGIPVYRHPDVLTETGSFVGKGEALWKSLHVLKGDIIAWIDTDIVNIHPRFVYGLLGPLLVSPRVKYVKGFYRRPLRVGDKLQAGGGGRVTELVVRPMFNLCFPELSGLVQPLSGEYAGRREVLERVPFFSGYSVETGLLIDIFSQYGLSAIAQVDLKERIHHNQTLRALSRMSFVIIQALLNRLHEHEVLQLYTELSSSMKLIADTNGQLGLDIQELMDFERPPIITVPAYRARHHGPVPPSTLAADQQDGMQKLIGD